ncbi:hypothetical protein M0802_004445 [Mischocyttarus mexicanus]|nr:hypothetical protein M0802_004445 [Mischocyttarus mexicanus]
MGGVEGRVVVQKGVVSRSSHIEDDGITLPKSFGSWKKGWDVAVGRRRRKIGKDPQSSSEPTSVHAESFGFGSLRFAFFSPCGVPKNPLHDY